MTKYRQESIKELSRYRDFQLSSIELFNEKHDSKRLGRFLNASGCAKPCENFEAHAIVSGNHQQARAARIILARLGIRIDDPNNGGWLPNFNRNIPHKKMPEAPAHRMLHTGHYYRNVVIMLNAAVQSLEPKEAVIDALCEIGKRVQQGKFPYWEGEKLDLSR